MEEQYPTLVVYGVCFMVCVHVAALVSFLIGNITLDSLLDHTSGERGREGKVCSSKVDVNLFTEIAVRRCFENKLLGKLLTNVQCY